MVKLITDPEKLAKPDISMFQSRDSGATAQAIQGVTQGLATVAGHVFQRQDQRALAGVSDQMSSLFAEQASRAQQLQADDLSAEEIASLDGTAAKLHRLKQLEKQKGVTSQYSSKLIAFQRQAIAANPRLRGEIEQMFSQQTGTTAGRIAQDLVNDPISQQMAEFGFAHADPDIEKNAQIQLESDSAVWHDKFYPGEQYAPLATKIKRYQEYNALQLSMDSKAKEAATATATNKQVADISEQLAMGSMIEGIQQIQSLVTSYGEEFRKADPERKAEILADLSGRAASLQAIAYNHLQPGANPRTANAVASTMNRLVESMNKYSKGEITASAIRNDLSIAIDTAKFGFANTMVGNQRMADLMAQGEFVKGLPDLLEAMGNSPMKQWWQERVQLGVMISSNNVAAMDAFEMAGVNSTEGYSQTLSLLRSVAANPQDKGSPQSLINLRNGFKSLYGSTLPELEKMDAQQRNVIMRSTLEALQDTNVVEFLKNEPQINNVMQQTVNKYAQDYARGINNTIDQALTESITSSLPPNAGTIFSDLPTELDDYIKPNISSNGIVLYESKFKSPSEVRALLDEHIKAKKDSVNLRTTTLNRVALGAITPSEEELNATAESIFDASINLSNKLTSTYSLPLQFLAKARMNITGEPDFVPAVEHVLKIKERSGTYLFQPYRPPEKGSQTQ